LGALAARAQITVAVASGKGSHAYVLWRDERAAIAQAGAAGDISHEAHATLPRERRAHGAFDRPLAGWDDAEHEEAGPDSVENTGTLQQDSAAVIRMHHGDTDAARLNLAEDR